MISESEWQSIYQAIERSQPASDMVHATVTKRDQKKKRIWLKEYGNEPIEFASWDYTFRIYDDEDDAWRDIEVEVQLPDKGDTVLVARPYGARRLARVVAPVQLSTGKRSPGRKSFTKVMQSFEPGQLVYDAGVLDHTASGPVDPYGNGKWLYCNGAAISRTTFKHLFKRIGTEHGNGDGSTTFNIPDFRNGLIPLPRGTAFSDVGATGGAQTVSLAIANLPSHSHSFSVDAHTHSISADGGHTHQPSSPFAGFLIGASTNIGVGGLGPQQSGDVNNRWAVGGMQSAGSHSHGGNTGSGGGGGGNTGSVGSGTALNVMNPYRIVGGVVIRTRR